MFEGVWTKKIEHPNIAENYPNNFDEKTNPPLPNNLFVFHLGSF